MYITVKNKEKYIFSKNSNIKFYNKSSKLNSYFNKIETKLYNLGYPYRLNLKLYLVIKYLLSTFLFLYIIFRYNNFFIAILILILFMIFPDVLIQLYKKNEGKLIINEISNIVQSLILSLSAGLPLYDALKTSSISVRYPRLKREYTIFLENYILYNFDIDKSVNEFSKKFDSYEFNMFLSILLDSKLQNNLLEILENFNENLELSYFKYLKFKSSKNTMMVIISTVIILIDTILLIMYPMLMQIIENLQKIFS